MAKVDSRKTRLSRKPGKTGSREKLIAGLGGARFFGFVAPGAPPFISFFVDEPIEWVPFDKNEGVVKVHESCYVPKAR